jgi:hypothetical protein
VDIQDRVSAQKLAGGGPGAATHTSCQNRRPFC